MTDYYNDAKSIATALNNGNDPIHQDPHNTGELPHFHMADHMFLGYYKHFHVWYKYI